MIESLDSFFLPMIEIEKHRSKAVEVPRVNGVPVLGSYLDYRNAPLSLFIDAYHKYGPLFELRFPGLSVLVVAGKAGIPILKNNPVERMHRRGLFDPFADEVGVDVFALQGDAHHEVRSRLALPYSRQLGSQFLSEVLDTVSELTFGWCPGDTVNLFEVSARIALQSMMAMVTPVRLKPYCDDFSKAGNTVMYSIFNLTPRAALKGPSYLSARNASYRVLDEVIERHAAGEFSDHSKMHVVDACLQVGGLSPKDIRGACLYALAGTEIYAGRLIGYMIFELLQNQGHLKRVLNEIDGALHEGLQDISIFRRMPYLRAAYFETLRCYPLLPGYPYYTEDETTVLGHRVPKGTYVLFVPHVEHFSSANYENPFVFDPQRCLPPRKEIARPGAFSPFGVGHRTCVAQGVSEVVTLSAVIQLLGRRMIDLDSPSLRMSVKMAPLIFPKTDVLLQIGEKRTPSNLRSTVSVLSASPDFEMVTGAGKKLQTIPVIPPTQYPKGTYLIRQGDKADAFYVLVEGEACVTKKISGTENEEHVCNLRAGEIFGEIGVLKRIPRTANVRAETDVSAIRIDLQSFISLVSEYDVNLMDLGAVIHMRFLQSVLSETLPHLAQNFSTKEFSYKHFEAKQTIFRQGDIADEFYVVAKGKVEVLTGPPHQQERVAVLGPGNFFGELGILTAQPRGATIIALEQTSCLTANRATFLKVIEENPDANKDIALVLFRRLAGNAQGKSAAACAPR